jgi:hypothetical protein
MQYRFTEDRTCVLGVTESGGVCIPWTDNPDINPDIAGNKEFQRLYAAWLEDPTIIAEPAEQLPPSP